MDVNLFLIITLLPDKYIYYAMTYELTPLFDIGLTHRRTLIIIF